MPFLYQTITVSAEEKHLDKWDLPSPKTYFLDDGSRDTIDVMQFTKNLRLDAPIHRQLSHRCFNGHFLHPSSEDDYSDEMGSLHDNFLIRSADNIQIMQALLPTDSLRSFTWNLGCCVPFELFGTDDCDGYLPRYQSKIQSLSLVFDRTCIEPLRVHGLHLLKELRSLSWKGTSGIDDHVEYDEYALIYKALVANSAHLQSLELEIFDSESTEWCSLDEITGSLFEEPVRLSRLQHLSLSYLSLNSTYDNMMIPFCMEKLKSLKLRSCARIPELLEHLADWDTSLKLRSFEVVFGDDWGVNHSLRQFFGSFQGLEEIYITTPRACHITYDKLLRVLIRCHRESLRRLILDKSPGEGLKPEKPNPSVFHDTFRQMTLEFVAIDDSPSYLRKALGSGTDNSQIKLLHLRIHGIRQRPQDLYAELTQPGKETGLRRDDLYGTKISMDDLSEFAEWAFGPTGLRSLIAIAYGDFTQGGRYKWSQVLLCRTSAIMSLDMETSLEPRSFRVVNPAQFHLVLDQIEGANEMLSACPTEHVQEWWVEEDMRSQQVNENA
ncbi:hypothetical protein BJX65DRAFT_311241 [Aspergillus insuetus]